MGDFPWNIKLVIWDTTTVKENRPLGNWVRSRWAKWNCENLLWKKHTQMKLFFCQLLQWPILSVALTLMAQSHQVKAGAKAKKIKEQAKNRRINDKHQRKFSFSLSLSLGVNGLYDVWILQVGEPITVSGEIGDILKSSRFQKYFTIQTNSSAACTKQVR